MLSSLLPQAGGLSLACQRRGGRVAASRGAKPIFCPRSSCRAVAQQALEEERKGSVYDVWRLALHATHTQRGELQRERREGSRSLGRFVGGLMDGDAPSRRVRRQVPSRDPTDRRPGRRLRREVVYSKENLSQCSTCEAAESGERERDARSKISRM